MSQFYTRYVPPDRSQSKTPAVQVNHLGKRKPAGPNDGLERKRQKTSNNVITPTKENVGGGGDSVGKDVLEKYSITRAAKSQDGDASILYRNQQSTKQQKRTRPDKTVEVKDRALSHGDENQSPVQDMNGGTQTHGDTKHAGVFRKYGRSQELSKSHGLDIIAEVNETPILRDLAPIPQPATGVDKPQSHVSSYSTLPTWQAEATTIGQSVVVPFSQLGLSQRLLSNLNSRGLIQAFPIQSTIIPLLISGPSLHRGDLCVAAATGSGKTLAYVVPIIEQLKRHRATGLRAVIVVPTRELVKQVRETCELCAAGSGIRIVTAVGSKSLQKEQTTLVKEEQIYDPETYKKEANTPIDWATFNLEDTLRQAAILAQRPDRGFNYITRRTIQADILITTPGRLVDHLENTRGFHLDDVRWLVVDEADRLLNEDYQDWINVVVPALESRKATEERDKILASMRLDLPPRAVKKVLLSATMTKDISRLQYLRLDNPKLVILSSSQEESRHPFTAGSSENVEEGPKDGPAGEFTLPSRLLENAVVLKEATDKPLILLQLLNRHVNTTTHNHNRKSPIRNKASSPQSNSETSSDSDSTTSSDSDDLDMDSGTSDSESSLSSDSDDEKSTDFPSSKATSHVSRQVEPITRVLVFTRSTDSASRLSRLLSILSPNLASKVATLTRGTTSSASSKRALSDFRQGKKRILIATDRASRGIDVPGLNHVISYDVPGSALTYIHRVGRTARAGQEGHAWTIVEHKEGKWFWQEIGGSGKDCVIRREQKVKKIKMEVEDEIGELKKRYDSALHELGSEVRGE